MKYNFFAIGQRIKGLRKERGWSQDKLIDVLQDKAPIGRNTLSSIENGNAKHFELSLLTALCDVFDCEMGYILCEYDNCKTRDLQFIHDMTGLSESSIDRLVTMNRNTNIGDATMYLLNLMIEDKEFLRSAAFSFKSIIKVPDQAIATISFYNQDNNHHIVDMMSNCSSDLKGLFMADLQNIIFSFLERQL